MAFDGLVRRSAPLLNLLVERVVDRGYFPKPSNSLFIADKPGQKESAKRDFAAEGFDLNFVGGCWYLGAYLGPR